MDWYEDPTQYTDRRAYPHTMKSYSGPHGIALVDVYADGKTTPGWGRMFMPNYNTNRFRAEHRANTFDRSGAPFAFVMRSLALVAIDIDHHDDGGPNGLEVARGLHLSPTLSETSRSGKGRHLFYSTYTPWDPDTGFGAFDDIISLRPGVDVRATGCVYHYETQLWAPFAIAPLPPHIESMLAQHKTRRVRDSKQLLAIKAAGIDSEEAVIMHDTLTQELAKPIPAGKRNNSLFAIGSKMMNAGVPDWESLITDRGLQIGLDSTEVDKIISNIGTYQP